MNECNYYENYLLGITNPSPVLAKTFQSETNYLANLLSLLPDNSKVLDIGCGIGRTIYNLVKDFSNINFYGLDLDSRMIVDAQKVNHYSNIFFTQGDISSNLFDANSFDLSYASYNFIGSIEESKISSFLKEQKRITRDDLVLFAWKRDSYTIDFLKNYYSSINVKTFISTNGELSTDKETRCISVDEILQHLKTEDIKVVSIDDISPLWVAVRGKKNV